MVGVSHTVMEGKTQDYEYLRIENAHRRHLLRHRFRRGRRDRVEAADVTRRTAATTSTRSSIPRVEFPRQISYRVTSQGWLYATLDGKVDGANKQVIYPMRRVGCESGELIRK